MIFLYFVLFSSCLAYHDIRTQSYPLWLWILGELPLVVIFPLNKTSLLLLVLGILAYFIPIGIGSGDFLYLSSLTLWLDFQQLLWIIQLASLFGIAYIFYRQKRQEPIPFIPFLALAGLVTVIITKAT